MKVHLSLAALCSFLIVGAVSAQTLADDNFNSMNGWNPVNGSWTAAGTLVQSDTETGLAMINRQLPQSGAYTLEYDVSYLNGGYADYMAAAQGKYHGGFGIHVGVDTPSAVKSWGNSKSYLLWFNLDTTVPSSSPYYGLRAQVYESFSNSRMSLMEDYNAEILPIEVVTANLDYLSEVLHVKFDIDTDSGEVTVYDPTVEDGTYTVQLDPAVLKGGYVSFRTNGMSAAFDHFKVTKTR